MQKEMEWLIAAFSKRDVSDHWKAENRINGTIESLQEVGYKVEWQNFMDEKRLVVSKSSCYVLIDIDTLIDAPKNYIFEFVANRMASLQENKLKSGE